ncbi:MAG TPA: rhodanese-like domain-containing protein [Verrucomicrobiae bacterium]|nr:rhodanese-like domain-containing protein [Verrucomicrobiae bacterium]
MSDPIISPKELKSILDSGAKLLLLDVRQPEEVQAASLPGATNIPMGEVPYRMDELDKGASIVVYCHHGMRSQQIVQLLTMRGFTDVRNLTGGINAWSVEVDAKTPRYDYDGRRIRVIG